LKSNVSIRNSAARDICFIGSENKMKGILQRMVTKGLIELVPETTRYSAAYRLVAPKAKLAGGPHMK
jgi:ATP-dependent DNA helicase RecG